MKQEDFMSNTKIKKYTYFKKIVYTRGDGVSKNLWEQRRRNRRNEVLFILPLSYQSVFFGQ